MFLGDFNPKMHIKTQSKSVTLCDITCFESVKNDILTLTDINDVHDTNQRHTSHLQKKTSVVCHSCLQWKCSHQKSIPKHMYIELSL